MRRQRGRTKSWYPGCFKVLGQYFNCIKSFCFSTHNSSILVDFTSKMRLTCTRASSFWGADRAWPAAPMWLWWGKQGGWPWALTQVSVSPVGSCERSTEDHVATHKCRDVIDTSNKRSEKWMITIQNDTTIVHQYHYSDNILNNKDTTVLQKCLWKDFSVRPRSLQSPNIETLPMSLWDSSHTIHILKSNSTPEQKGGFHSFHTDMYKS